MGERDNVYTSGSWLVKAGKEGDFILTWETFARWTGEHQTGMEGEARLLQDTEEPRRFISIGRWSDMRKVQTWRESPEFRDFFAKVSELCEDLHPHVLKSVVRVAHYWHDDPSVTPSLKWRTGLIRTKRRFHVFSRPDAAAHEPTSSMDGRCTARLLRKLRS